MAFGGLLDDRQRRWLFALAIALLSLSLIPFIPMVSDFMAWQIGNTDFTVGAVIAVIGLYAAYLISPLSRTL